MPSRVDKAAKLTKAFEDFLRAVDKSPGSNPELLDTPVRTANMWLDELLDGYDWDPEDILSGGSALGPQNDAEMVVVRDIFFHSTCPHHLLPFHGVAHVAYIPTDRIVGLSKLARLVDCFAHRLILQEEIAQQVASSLVTHLGARGAACMLDAEQLCMVIRGVRKQGSRAVVVDYAGSMSTDTEAKKQFLAAINAKE